MSVHYGTTIAAAITTSLPLPLMYCCCYSYLSHPPPAPLLHVAKKSLGWGLTVTLGVPKLKSEISAHYALFLSGRILRGSLIGGWKPKSDVPKLVDMYLRKHGMKLQLPRLAWLHVPIFAFLLG